jgi:hypothetical protein
MLIIGLDIIGGDSCDDHASITGITKDLEQNTHIPFAKNYITYVASAKHV